MSSNVVSIRTDAEVEAALAELGDTYGNRTATLKAALLKLAEHKREHELRLEAERIANDPLDRAEIEAVWADMEPHRAW